VADHLWGTVDSNLPTPDGVPVFQVLNDGFLAGPTETGGIPPIVAFNGRHDTVVGWAEKIPFYASMRAHHQGGYYFWDPRDHMSSYGADWMPMQSTRYLYRYRLDCSYPALSNCSVDGNPGNGDPADGDSVGCINAYVEWDTLFLDQPTTWETTLWTRALQLSAGTDPGPDSARVDVTPRRLQQFITRPGLVCPYVVTRVSDGAVVQSGSVVADSSNLITVPAVKVYRGGTRLRITRPGNVDVAAAGSRGAVRPSIALARNPVSAHAAFRVLWPRSGVANVRLIDVSGRLVQWIQRGPVSAGEMTLHLDTNSVSGGVYFLSAEQGGARAMSRVVVVH